MKAFRDETLPSKKERMKRNDDPRWSSHPPHPHISTLSIQRTWTYLPMLSLLES